MNARTKVGAGGVADGLLHRDHKTVGGLILLLESCEPEKHVGFDFCGMAPNGIHVRRDSLESLALGFAPMMREQWPTVRKLIGVLYGAIHQTFHGPNSSFKASAGTPLWVGNPAGGDGYTVITGIHDLANVYLRTEHWEVWS